MGLAIVLGLAVLAVVAILVASRFAGGPAPARGGDEERPDILDVAPVRLPDAPRPAAFEDEPPEAITWTAQFTAAPLDESARLRLIDDLGLLRAAWSVALLRRAHEEERAAHVRARIEEALAACGEPAESAAL